MRKMVVLDMTVLIGCLIGSLVVPEDENAFKLKLLLITFMLAWALRAYLYYWPLATYTYTFTDAVGTEFESNPYPTLNGAMEAADLMRDRLPSPNYLRVTRHD